MRCGDLEVVVVERGSHLEGDDARVVARRVVCAALLDVPRLGLGKIGEPRCGQAFSDCCSSVEHTRAFADEVEELLCCAGVLRHRLGAACAGALRHRLGAALVLLRHFDRPFESSAPV